MLFQIQNWSFTTFWSLDQPFKKIIIFLLNFYSQIYSIQSLYTKKNNYDQMGELKII